MAALQLDPDAAAAGENDGELQIRKLAIGDYEKGYFDLLNQLTTSPAVPFPDFAARFSELAALGDTHLILVAEDPRLRRVVASGTLFVERKLLGGGRRVGHVEDVVVDAAARGRGVGIAIVRRLVDHARAAGCSKVMLDCTSELRGYYGKCGFVDAGSQMAFYF